MPRIGQDIARVATVYVDAYNVSGDLNEVGIDISANHPEDTAFGDTHITRTASGLGEWSMTQSGYFSDTTTAGSPGIEEVLRNAYGKRSTVEWYGHGVGASTVGYAGIQPSIDWSVGAPLDNVLTLNATYSGDEPLFRVYDLTGETTSSCTSGSTATSNVDLSGSMTQAAGFLRVLAGSATTGPSGVFTIEHNNSASVNCGSCWTPLIAFSTVTGSNHQYQEVSSASQYVRVNYNISDGGGNNAEFTYHISFGPALNPGTPAANVVGVEWDQSTDTWTTIDISGGSVTFDANTHPTWNNITRVDLAASGSVNATLGDPDYSAASPTGTIMVRIPKFWVRSESPAANKYRWWIGDKFFAGSEVHPAFRQRGGGVRDNVYIGAYEACLKDDSGTLKLHSKSGEQPFTGASTMVGLAFDGGSAEFTIGEKLTGGTSSASGQVTDYHLTGGTWGGGNASGSVYMKQVEGTFSNNEQISGDSSGSVMANGANSNLELTIGNARTYAENIGTGWGSMSIWTLSAIQLLHVIEYGDFDSQTNVGRGVVDLASGAGFAGVETGADSIDSQLNAAGTGAGTGTDGQTPIAYRYLENIWGNVWSFVDGFNAVDAEYRIINRSGTGTFADTLAAGDYEATSAAPITSDGYIDNIVYEGLTKYLFVGSSVGGASNTHIPDYLYAHDAGETNILLAGGDWAGASTAGLAMLYATDVASLSNRFIGARAEFSA